MMEKAKQEAAAKKLADIFNDFAQKPDRAKLNRRLNMMQINFPSDKQIIKKARIVMFREMNGR